MMPFTDETKEEMECLIWSTWSVYMTGAMAYIREDIAEGVDTHQAIKEHFPDQILEHVRGELRSALEYMIIQTMHEELKC